MKNKIKIFKYIELVLVFLSATAIWYLADNLFKSPQNSNWSWIMPCVVLFFIVWSLGSIIIRSQKLFMGATFLALLSQVVFTRDVGSLLIIFVSLLFLYIARKFIKHEIGARLKVDIWNYLRIGRRFIVLAIALMLAGQYYFSDSAQVVSENLPKTRINYSQGGFMARVISLVDPSLIKENKESVTVDEFILNKLNEESRYSQNPSIMAAYNNMAPNQKYLLLDEGRNDISMMVERNVSGDEKMVDIFLEIINNKINSLLNIDMGYMDKNLPVAHLIITAALFLAVMGTGMFLSLIFILLAVIIFKALVFFEVLSIDKRAVNMDVIKIG